MTRVEMEAKGLSPAECERLCAVLETTRKYGVPKRPVTIFSSVSL